MRVFHYLKGDCGLDIFVAVPDISLDVLDAAGAAGASACLWLWVRSAGLVLLWGLSFPFSEGEHGEIGS